MTFDFNYEGKLGKFNFKLTKSILVSLGFLFIASGVGMFAAPWWADIVFYFFEYLTIPIDTTARNYVASFFILIGVICFLIKYQLYKDEKKLTHDKKVIEQKGIPLSDLTEYFEQLLADHSFYSSKDTIFYNSYNSFTDLFLQKKTKKLYDEYRENAKKLHNFLATNFFVYPDNQPLDDYRYCMQPRLNIDRGGFDQNSEYPILSKELKSKVELAFSNYQAFVRHLRESHILDIA